MKNKESKEDTDGMPLWGHLMGQLRIMGVSRREERERNKWFESLFEEKIMAPSFQI